MKSLKNNIRFELREQLGEGSFSKIFEAKDLKYNRTVALKVEKEDKNKRILNFEYDVLKNLQILNCVPRVYDFVENSDMNLIVLELLGKNVASFKKQKGMALSNFQALDILIQMLNCIEAVHNLGYIHRDIKPSNFVLDQSEKKVYIVDFGLSKLHLSKIGIPNPKRAQCDFRGTLAFASMNAHNHIDLGRRDDLWSFFFVILDLFNEFIPWRHCGDNKDLIERRKKECIENPEKMLMTSTCNKKELFDIFYYIKSLKYETKPDYAFIRNKLQELLSVEVNRFKELSKGTMNYVNQATLIELFNNNSNFVDYILKETKQSSSGGANLNQYKQLNHDNEGNQNFLRKKRTKKYFKIGKDQKKLDTLRNIKEAKKALRYQSPLEIVNTANFEIDKYQPKIELIQNDYLKIKDLIEMIKVQNFQNQLIQFLIPTYQKTNINWNCNYLGLNNLVNVNMYN